MLSLTCYFSKKDTERNSIIEDVRPVCEKVNAVLVEIAIDGDADLEKRFGGRTPVLQAGPYTLNYPFSMQDVEVVLSSAQQRVERMTKNTDSDEAKRLLRGQSITRGDRFGLWFARNYVYVILAILVIFAGLPVLAPVLEKTGHSGAANVIYTIYRPLCHQFAFRSYFLFGEQAVYPRALANVPGLLTYEQVTGVSAFDINFARNFIGNPVLGYKMAFCERDLAMYGSLALFALLFQLTGRKMKQLPWYLWVIIAIIPIGLDGLTQLPSLLANPISWLPFRESTPFDRVFTGVLFGFFSGWFMFPLMEESVALTRMALSRKFSVIKKIEESVRQKEQAAR